MTWDMGRGKKNSNDITLNNKCVVRDTTFVQYCTHTRTILHTTLNCGNGVVYDFL